MYSIHCAILKIFNAFNKLYCIKQKVCLVLRLAFYKVPYVLESIGFAIVMAYSSESFLTVSCAGCLDVKAQLKYIYLLVCWFITQSLLM